MKGIILHLKEEDIDRDFKQWHLELYGVIQDFARDNSIRFERKVRDKDIKVGTHIITDERFYDGCLHIIDDRSISHPNVLNAGVAYFWGFWHLDPKGIKAFSSIGDLEYDESLVPEDEANIFYKTLVEKYVHKRLSKYDQEKEIKRFPKKSIGLFFQGNYPKKSGASKYSDIDILDMLINVAGDRNIIVKPHPLSSDISDIIEAAQRSESDKRVIITDANVHDILKSVDITVSNNSTVALEGFLHNKPAIILGKSDFHHAAFRVDDENRLYHILKEKNNKPNFINYLFWYFRMNCLEVKSIKDCNAEMYRALSKL